MRLPWNDSTPNQSRSVDQIIADFLPLKSELELAQTEIDEDIIEIENQIAGLENTKTVLSEEKSRASRILERFNTFLS